MSLLDLILGSGSTFLYVSMDVGDHGPGHQVEDVVLLVDGRGCGCGYVWRCGHAGKSRAMYLISAFPGSDLEISIEV